MRLRSAIIACGALSMAVLVSGGAFVYAQFDLLGRAFDQSRALGRLEGAATDLAISATRFAHSPSEPRRLTLVEANARLVRELDSPLPGAFARGPLATDVATLMAALRALAREIGTAAATAATCGDLPDLTNLCESATRLTEATRRLRDRAAPMIEATAAKAARGTKNAEAAALGVFLALGALTLAFWTTVHARALRPLADLGRACAIVGAGRLDHRAPEGRDDEIGDIVRGFNAMAASLERVSASRADLEAEIARRAALEAALRRRNDELVEANAELDAFARIAAHDLRAPVRGIAALTGWLAEDFAESAPPEHLFHLAMMRGRVERLDNLLDGLQRYVGLGRMAHAVESVDVAALARRIAAEADPADRFGVEAVDLGGVFAGQRALVELVLRILIENAVRHHDRSSGRVVVTAALGETTRTITVSDDGPGVPADLQGRVFELFQTLKPRDEVEGAGLGLSVARKAARLMGGTITLASPVAQGRGCAFTLHLPCAAPAP